MAVTPIVRALYIDERGRPLHDVVLLESDHEEVPVSHGRESPVRDGVQGAL